MVQAQALVVVHLQRAFTEGEAALPRSDELIDRVGGLVAAATRAGALVVQLQEDGPPGSAWEPDSDGWALSVPAPDPDSAIRTTIDDGFDGTDLEQRLRDHGVAVVVIAGLQSEMCVAATARGALARGFRVVLPRDAHATYAVPPTATTPEIPDRHVSRVAEWSLGDEIVAPESSAEVSFVAAPERAAEPSR